MSDLHLLGAALGSLDLAQGPGGNASLKRGPTLMVKASGVRLRELDSPDAVATVDLAVARAALDGDPAAERALASLRPRPSLETFFHALGPRAVAHTHPLGALLVACSHGRSPPAVAGARVVEIAYARPGRPLAVLVREALADDPGPTLALLRSHGLIAFADTAAAAVDLTLRFDRACRARYGDVPAVAARVARLGAAGPLAVAGGLLLPLPPRVDAGHTLFPDAAVFCPRVTVASLAEPAAVAAELLALAPRATLVSDGARRALVAPSPRALDHAVEVLAAHELLEASLGDEAAPLAPAEALAIAAMPSELHRLAVAARG
jgi:ribulose-5-phosphate 4-epimerase/fuculose-1-phosphate aldolase